MVVPGNLPVPRGTKQSTQEAFGRLLGDTAASETALAEAGQSVYFRLSNHPIEQPSRTIDPDLAEAIIAGGYWLREPEANAELAIAYCGAVAPEALAAHQAVADDIPGAASRQPVGCRLTG